jgi:hypothetical protein
MSRACVVAPLALVEPDFVRADDAADVCKMLGRGVIHERVESLGLLVRMQPKRGRS